MQVHKYAAAKRTRKTPRTFPVVTVQVCDAAWNTALALAHGNVRRLRVIDQNTVIVINQG